MLTYYHYIIIPVVFGPLALRSVPCLLIIVTRRMVGIGVMGGGIYGKMFVHEFAPQESDRPSCHFVLQYRQGSVRPAT